MKTIYIMSKELRDYVINISQITCIHDSQNDGNIIVLSCGTKIRTDKSISEKQKMIVEASN
ncbi:hypothetical protein [Flavobacterium sp. LB2P6]|uniref:hypothetical protein n=1 Tax=Flavobacterium sp. LB2P6 TaxID=3401714 RepID=UPI003AADAE3B